MVLPVPTEMVHLPVPTETEDKKQKYTVIDMKSTEHHQHQNQIIPIIYMIQII